MEYLKSTPPILLDGAHNPQGARALARAIPKYFTYKRIIMVLAILDDKDKREILGSLAPLGDIIVVTKVPDNPRNQDWRNIADIPEIKSKDIFFVEEPTKAIDLALQMSNEEDLVVITGSLYLLGVSREYVLKFSPLA
jgi:dihydrofolate synthase/folylpolyglutamate synthase